MKLPNVLFQDFDGVLNSELFFRSRETRATRDEQIDPASIEILNSIISQTEAKVVISSTWRKLDVCNTVEKAQGFLEKYGFKGEVIGLTPNSDHGYRGLEIKKWLDTNGYPWNFRRYIIADDDSDMLLNQKENFFQIDGYTGITHNVAYRIVNFLKSFEI